MSLSSFFRSVFQRLEAATGTGKVPTLSKERVAALDDAFADAAGVPTVVKAVADSTRLPGRFQWLSMVPQWDFLDFLTAEAQRSPSFGLHRQVEVVGVIEEDGVVTGVRHRRTDGDGGETDLCALLTVAADGRHNAVRRAAGMSRVEFGAPWPCSGTASPRPPATRRAPSCGWCPVGCSR